METVLQSNQLMPDEAFAAKRDKYTGGKFSNDRVLVKRNANDTEKQAPRDY